MKQTHYVAREPDAQGFIHYPPEEHAVWNTLITRQLKVIEGRACQEYLDGIDKLGLPLDRIPQLGEINKVLAETTGALLRFYGGQADANETLGEVQQALEALAWHRGNVEKHAQPELDFQEV